MFGSEQTLLPPSPDTLFLQLGAKVGREPCKKQPVAHDWPTTSSVRQFPWLQSVCKRPIRAGVGSSWARHISQGSDGGFAGLSALCVCCYSMSVSI